jgi:ligand-binding sensor domain-containing protein
MVNKKRYIRILKFVLLVILLVNIKGANAQIDFKALEFNTVKENIFQRPITAMVVDRFGFIWIGTDGAGLYRFNGISYNYYSHDLADRNSINSNSISSLFLDSSGKLWIGTDAGLSLYDDKKNSFTRIETRINSNKSNDFTSALCFAEYEGRP